MSPTRAEFGPQSRASTDPEEHGSCAWPECVEAGAFKAPRSPQALRDYQWFCLEHIREFNKSWNFFRNVSGDELEAAIRSDTTWNRPTWPLGGIGPDNKNARPDPFVFDSIRDPFGFFSEDLNSPGTSPAQSSGIIGQALDELGLRPPVGLDEVKARYKTLVKRHHPDANGGDKEAEEKLKAIIEAYDVLKAELVS
jgi:hypothetical protein